MAVASAVFRFVYFCSEDIPIHRYTTLKFQCVFEYVRVALMVFWHHRKQSKRQQQRKKSKKTRRADDGRRRTEGKQKIVILIVIGLFVSSVVVSRMPNSTSWISSDRTMLRCGA